MADWSQLPYDLLSSLLDRLPFPDLVRCKSVCTSWRSVCDEKKYPASAPWLVLCDFHEEDKTRGFFSISDQMTHRLKLPELSGKYCCGSSKGWLVTLDLNFEMHLLQPFSGISIRLPSPPLYCEDEDEFYSRQELCRIKVWRAIVSSDPVTSPENCVIMAIHNARCKLAFLRLGDEKWTSIEDAFGAYWDVTFYRGQFVGATSLEDIVVCDLEAVPQTRLFASRLQRESSAQRYLVESDGELLCIIRFTREDFTGNIDEGDDSHEEWRTFTTGFEVYKLDMDSRRWVQITSIGDRVIFVGLGPSMSFQTSDVPGCKGNSIYFTDDEICRSTCHGCYDLGAYSMEDQTVKPYYPRDVFHPVVSPPAWFDASSNFH